MKSFKISNFRLINNHGVNIAFKPITVLTGANSSGKSSYVKALVLFRDFLDGILNEYNRNGGFNPSNHDLKFTNPDLQLGGFSNTLNRSASAEDLMSFSLTVQSFVSVEPFEVTYSFEAQDNRQELDYGILKEITVSHKEKDILHATRLDNGQMNVDYLNCSNLMSDDFLYYCLYCCLPYNLWADCEMSGGYVDEESIMATDRGKRIAKLQNTPSVVVNQDLVSVGDLPNSIINKYKNLFYSDLLEPLEKGLEYNIVFFFPVLELFRGKNKEESIQILREKARGSRTLSGFSPAFGDEKIKATADKIINHFQDSEYDSFIDYYRSLENYVLENVNSSIIPFIRKGESFNFIEDHIIRKIDVSFDIIGDTKRDEKETLFSVVYNFLSLWEWGEGEAHDSEWMRINNDGKVISDLWHKSDSYIKRDIDWDPFYYHSKHVLFDAFKDYLSLVLTDCLLPKDLSRLQYNTSSFTSVQRLHSFEDKSHFVSVIQQYLEGRSYLLKHADNKFLLGNKEFYKPDTFLDKWLGNNGLNICKGLGFEVPQGLGFSILLKQNGYNEYLADVGHGITQIISILLQIEGMLIQNEKLDIERAYKQEKHKPTTAIICIEEPEVSLHPCYQSLLADILYDAVKNYEGQIGFIVETHSEYFIRKIQALVSGFSEEQFKDNPFAVFYFTRDGGAYDLGFKKSGRFERDFGPGFFDETANLKYILFSNEAK